MTTAQQTSLFVAFAIVVALFVFLSGSLLTMLFMNGNMMSGTMMTNGMMGMGMMNGGMMNNAMVGGAMAWGMTWLGLPSLLTLVVGILIASSLFIKK